MTSPDPSDLSALTPEALTSRISQLLGEERVTLVTFLRHLAELERRRLHLALGYSSSFVYCTEHLRLSKASAFRRTTAARLLSRFPEVAAYLLDGRLGLTTLCLLKDVLTEESAAEILERAAGRTENEVEVLVASLRPRPALPDLIRALPSRETTGPEPAASPQAPLGSGAEPTHSQESQDILASPVSQAPRRAAVEPLDEKLHVIRMTVGPEFMAELEEVKAALSHQVPPGATLEVLLRRCFRVVLDASSKRRRGGMPRKKAAPEQQAPSPEKPRSRYIPVAVRREVWERDGGRCAFVGSSGKRCGSQDRLEFHHDGVPFARGGEPTAASIELRCRSHNLYEARLDFGDELMERFTRQGASARGAS